MTQASTTPLRAAAAEEVRVWMARRKISGVRLAAMIGRTQPYLSRRLTGEVAFDLDDLEAIATALGIQPAQLLPRGQGGAATLGYPVTPGRGAVKRLTLIRGTPDGRWRPTVPALADRQRPIDRRPPGYPQRYRMDAAR